MSLAPAVFALWLAAAAEDQVQGAIVEAYKAAEGLQGGLDGAWRLEDADGGLLYVFEISDPGGGGTIEGAWRDPRHLGAAGSSGFLASIRRGGDGLDIRFGSGLFAPQLVLKPTPDGGWAGQLIHDGPRRRVVMSRF